jgi:hypothetical protein
VNDGGTPSECCVTENVSNPDNDCPIDPFLLTLSCAVADDPDMPGTHGVFPSHPILSQLTGANAYNGCDGSGVIDFFNNYDFAGNGDTLQSLNKPMGYWPLSCSNNGCCLDNKCGEKRSCELALTLEKITLLIEGVYPADLPPDEDILEDACGFMKKCDANSGCCISVVESE